jgi:hypothetical protein
MHPFLDSAPMSFCGYILFAAAMSLTIIWRFVIILGNLHVKNSLLKLLEEHREGSLKRNDNRQLVHIYIIVSQMGKNRLIYCYPEKTKKKIEGLKELTSKN